MVHPCNKPCGNKTASGYCATTACINPQYSNIGTVYYGQGVQKRIITNYDRLRAKSVEEMAEWLDRLITHCNDGPCFNCFMREACLTSVLDWLQQEDE